MALVIVVLVTDVFGLHAQFVVVFFERCSVAFFGEDVLVERVVVVIVLILSFRVVNLDLVVLVVLITLAKEFLVAQVDSVSLWPAFQSGVFLNENGLHPCSFLYFKCFKSVFGLLIEHAAFLVQAVLRQYGRAHLKAAFDDVFHAL